MYMYAQDGVFAVGAKATKRKCIGQIEHHLHMPWLIHRASKWSDHELWREVSSNVVPKKSVLAFASAKSMSEVEALYCSFNLSRNLLLISLLYPYGPYVFAALSPCKSLLAAGLFNLPFLQRAGHMHGTTKAWNHGKRVWEDIWSAMEIRTRFVQQAMKSVSTYDINVDLEVHIIFNISYPTARGDNPHPPQRSIQSVFEFYREGFNRLNVIAHVSHVASSNSHNKQKKKQA